METAVTARVTMLAAIKSSECKQRKKSVILMMMAMFVPHGMIVWFRECNGVCAHADIKIGCNDDLHDCLNKSATLLHNKAFFALPGTAAGICLY